MDSIIGMTVGLLASYLFWRLLDRRSTAQRCDASCQSTRNAGDRCGAGAAGDSQSNSGDIPEIGESSRENCAIQREMRKRLESNDNILRSMMDMLIVIDLDGKIARVNESTCQLLGFDEDELLGKPAAFIICAAESDTDVQLEADTLSTDVVSALREFRDINNIECWYVTRDQRKIPVSFSSAVMVDADGSIQGTACIARDNTECKLLQYELAQSQKLESVGELAAGIAHEINTPTQYVGDNTRFLKDAFAEIQMVLDEFRDMLETAKQGQFSHESIARAESTIKKVDLPYLIDEIPQAIDQSLEGIQRVSKIVRAMKEFSHPGSEEKTPVNIAEAIETTLTVARSEWKYVAEITTRFDPNLPKIYCATGKLNQVFLNLIVNAAQSIGEKIGETPGEKGRITIETEAVGQWGEIRIQDTGTGIDPQTLPRIFDPFFTTKERGRGTGQGLAIARGVIVDKHGGSIDCETRLGEGTTFKIRLPLAHPKPLLLDTSPASAVVM